MVFVKKEYVFVWLYRPSRQASRTPEWSLPLHKKYHIDPLKFIQNTLLHPKHGFCQKEICVHPAISPFAGRLLALRSGVHHCTRAGEEFTTAQEVPDTSPQMHSKYIPTYLTMVLSKKDICVRPALSPFAAGHLHSGAEFITAQEPVWSSPLHQIVLDRFAQMHSKYIPTSLTMVFVKQKNCSSSYIALHCRLPALRSGVPSAHKVPR